ncbi:MAG: hypothetical protein DWQ09_08700 [Proteobacteria bacterium]|nr:MAG: hypothetical protein DWQ09_08700 [Pseudomonadota bacterium]QKK10760.1 MAG: hypothetical protein HND59_03290 [Pseudomonadota bacterium]
MAHGPDKSRQQGFISLTRDKALMVALLLGLVMTDTGAALAADDAGTAALQQVESIMILPVVYPEGQTDEDREERFDNLYGKLDEYIYKALLRKLALKGYVLDRPRSWSVPPGWNVETLKDMTPDQLAALAPARAEHVAFLFIESIDSTNNVVQTSANAAVSAMIIDRETGTVAWRRRVEEEFSEHILQIFSPIGMLLTPDKHVAIENAFSTLFEDLPERAY